MSHSLRSAWIEIVSASVLRSRIKESHSLRSAWIEIVIVGDEIGSKIVALLTECVDRNVIRRIIFLAYLGRTPYGVRG